MEAMVIVEVEAGVLFMRIVPADLINPRIFP